MLGKISEYPKIHPTLKLQTMNLKTVSFVYFTLFRYQVHIAKDVTGLWHSSLLLCTGKTRKLKHSLSCSKGGRESIQYTKICPSLHFKTVKLKKKKWHFTAQLCIVCVCVCAQAHAWAFVCVCKRTCVHNRAHMRGHFSVCVKSCNLIFLYLKQSISTCSLKRPSYKICLKNVLHKNSTGKIYINYTRRIQFFSKFNSTSLCLW